MKIRYILLLLLLLFSFMTTTAQSEDTQIQEFYAEVSAESRYSYFDLFGMEAGTTIYIYAESDDIDTKLFLCDIACEESFAENDDIDFDAGISDSAIEYTFEVDGDYSIAVSDCCDENAEGSFRLLLGLNAPEVLTGFAEPTGDTIAVPYGTEQITATEPPIAQTGDAQIQEFYAEISAEAQYSFFDLFGMETGTTIYLYAESDEIDTEMILCDIECAEVFADNDDIDFDAGITNSAIEYTFEADGDYGIAVGDCCNEAAEGSLRLLVGLDAPQILTGAGDPTGETIAVPWSPEQVTTTENFTAQSTEPQIQEFYSLVSPENEFVYFDLFGMEAGTTIYLYAESAEFDTRLIVCDIDCVEIFADNDDIDVDNGNTNSALEYTFEADGDYSIVITDCCESDVTGIFRFLIGFNAPQVLTGVAYPTGDVIAIPWEDSYTDLTATAAVTQEDAQVQQFYDALSEQSQFVYYDIFGANAGETLYLYAASDDIDTYILICDIICEEIYVENDDIDLDAGNTNSALEFVFPEDGDYSIAVTAYSVLYEEDIVEGAFRLLLGYNSPQVLTGIAVPNGAEIATLYEPEHSTVDTTEIDRTTSASCEELELTERPTLSGPERTAETDNFVIHYTLDGNDAATEAFVAEVLAFVETSLEIQTQDLAWPAPPRDCGEGGDTRFDFYLQEILDADNVYGYAVPGNTVGDNPFSDYEETWAAYSYMIIDNDFRGSRAPLVVMRATVAHEFHHTIQFGYDIADALNWYYESTASWIETKTSTDQDATGYTAAVMEYPDVCIGTLNEQTGVRVYGEWLLIDSIAQDSGDDSIIRLWEYVADYEGMDVYYNFLDSLDTTPYDVLRRFSVRNLLIEYPFADVFPQTVRIEAQVNGTGDVRPSYDGVQEMSADFVLIRRKGIYTFSINQTNLELVVVGVNRSTDSAQIFELGQAGTVDTTQFDNSYVIIINTDQHTDPNDCNETQWVLSVEDGTDESLAQANGEKFDASNFMPAG